MLLDTATFLWIITDAEELSTKAKRTYLDKNKKIYLSSVSFWEITVKYKLGRISLPQKPSIFIPKQRKLHSIESMSLEESDISELEKLPDIHKDPFDRMLICQARSRGLTILTPDKTIASYPVKTAW